MKIDIFNHIFPPRFFAAFLEAARALKDMGKRVRNIPTLYDLDARFRMMDEFGEYRQVISIASPPLESFTEPAATARLSVLANDGMAELVDRHPARFPGFVAQLPMNDPAAALKELERVDGMGALGVQIFTNVGGRPLDGAEFRPIFADLAARGMAVWLHPARGAGFADYQTESRSRYEIWWTFGWPYETSVAMARLVFDGIFDRHPDLKIIVHHMGAMIPYFEGRVGYGWDQLGTRSSDEDYTALLRTLKKRPADYFRMFYADTALFGARAGTVCGLSYFGADRVLFASDTPFEPSPGLYIRETIKVIESLDLTPADKAKIYKDNARQLLYRQAVIN